MSSLSHNIFATLLITGSIFTNLSFFVRVGKISLLLSVFGFLFVLCATIIAIVTNKRFKANKKMLEAEMKRLMN
jgi:flagellar motor component MotA